MILIGLGTGRCGTHSLATLLKNQESTRITHEFGDTPAVTWEVDENILSKIIHSFTRIDNQSPLFTGDVGFYHLPYVDRYIEEWKEDVKFIAIKRDANETIKSYHKWTEGRNHWQEHPNGSKPCVWDPCYPKYDVKNKNQALQLYWEDYYDRIDEFMEKYPNQFYLMDMYDLNDKDKIKSMLEWCGYKNPKLDVGIRESKQNYGNS